MNTFFSKIYQFLFTGYFGSVMISFGLFMLPQQNLAQTGACRIKAHAYLENNCIVPIDRYLSRPITMSYLAGVNTVPLNPDNPCADPSVEDDHGCDPDYDNPCQGFNGYCPDRYWDDIEMCVELKASMVLDVATSWGGEDQVFIPGANYYTAATQAVQDINKAYDCAGLRRPIIGAATFEYVSTEVDKVKLPESVIYTFESEMNDIEKSVYFDGSSPKNNLNFNYSNINSNTILYGPDPVNHVDLNKIEARMWKYYCARKYIDDGYKAIHMGILYSQAYNDHYPVENYKTYDLYNKIRAYADSKGTFVLLFSDQNESMYYSNTDLLVADINAAQYLLDEVDHTCLDMQLTSYVPGPIESVINRYTGGTAPSGCHYDSRGPFMLACDNNGGYPVDADPVSNTNPTDHVAGWDVWGYDEIKWFTKVLEESEECAADALAEIVCGVRNMDDSHRGFAALPGRRKVDPWFDGVGWFRLYDHAAIKDRIINDLWKPNNNNEILLSTECEKEEEEIIGQCSSTEWKYQKYYTFSTPNPDCTTVYTWHIKNPNGSWQEINYGPSATIKPSMSGTYKVSLRRDNFVFGGKKSPTGTNSVTYFYDLEYYCCGEIGDPVKADDHHNEDSIQGLVAKNLFLIYPNPSTGKFIVDITLAELSLSETLQFEITSSIGKKVYSHILEKGIKKYKKEYDFSDTLEGGIYIATIKANSFYMQKKFIIIK